MGWWRYSFFCFFFQQGCWRKGRGSKKNRGESKTEGEFTAQTLSCPSVPPPLLLMPPSAFQSVLRPGMLPRHSQCLSDITKGFGFPRFADSPNPSVCTQANFSRWQSAARAVGRTTRLPACFALTTSSTWSGTDSARETASLFTLTGFYDPAATPGLVLGARADAWFSSYGTVIEL